jgi:signal transduction histidine kinase
VTEAVAAFDQINSAAARTSEIIRALRALAKQTPASLAPLAIDEVLISVLELMRPEIDDRRVRLSMSLSASGKAVFGDGVQLQQVVLNLITNALEAMTETPAPARKLAVSSQVEGGYVCVKVSDSGTGMDETTLENIFDPFFTTKSTGIGMGLAICRSIMEAHGGTLEASSEPGHGSTLTFSIPVAARI